MGNSYSCFRALDASDVTEASSGMAAGITATNLGGIVTQHWQAYIVQKLYKAS